jgi:hypothetical protein
MTSRSLQATPAGTPVRTCRWIDGDVREPGWRYCGQQALTGRSWCAEHSARAYLLRDNQNRSPSDNLLYIRWWSSVWRAS